MSSGPIEEGRRLVTRADQAGVTLRLFGGVAIWERSTEATRRSLGREYADLDLVSHRSSSRQLRELLENEGYEPERVFNATHGSTRLLYHAPGHGWHIDVFLDQFEMSHKLDLGARLETEPLTLPAAELLLAKLQVAEVNQKDLTDAAMLLLDHELADEDGPGFLNEGYVSEVCAADWGLFTTATENLESVAELVGGLPVGEWERASLREKCVHLRQRLEDAPKTRAWKLRARIGKRKRWYEVPEEVVR
jgi:hypothetical protein